MSEQSRVRATAKLATSAKGSATSGAWPASQPNAVLVRWGTFLAGGLIVLAALAAYHNSFSGPFILDDNLAITANPSIKHLGSALSPPATSTTCGRPVVGLTFALNYALGGMKVWGYHAFNLLVHTLAGLTLFGLVRRTLASHLATRGFQISDLKSKIVAGTATAQSEISNLKFEISADATLVAAAVAVIWTVHPLQTEAVTYISQRAESLMGLFYLLMLYCFVRGAEGGQSRVQSPETGDQRIGSQLSALSSRLWAAASILACALGMAAKEVMVTAPLMVLLYDRTFVAGSFREAWWLRWRYYLGLACTWLLLAGLMTGLNQRGVGFDQKVSWWSYALTSCRSVVLYLKLAVWPHPLVFDYGTRMVQHATDIIPYALVLALLLLATLVALRYRPVIGFASAWFFMILAPASSVIPVAHQPMAEHRMYLPLAAVVLLVLLGLYRLIGRRSLMVSAAAAAGLGWLTVQRNQDYKSELSIWSDTMAKCPDNERAHDNLGNTLRDMPGRLPDAIDQYRMAVQIKPDYAEAYNDLGNALSQMPGQLSEAMAAFETALRIQPHYATAHYNMANSFVKLGRWPDAIAEYETALQFEPGSVETHNNLGSTLLNLPGRWPDAIAQYEMALQLDPNSAEAHFGLGYALLNVPGRAPDAIDQFKAALRLKPDFKPAQDMLDHLQHPTSNIQRPTSK